MSRKSWYLPTSRPASWGLPGTPARTAPARTAPARTGARLASPVVDRVRRFQAGDLDVRAALVRPGTWLWQVFATPRSMEPKFTSTVTGDFEDGRAYIERRVRLMQPRTRVVDSKTDTGLWEFHGEERSTA
jgi:hypothetical protein